jgi:hypothetical protein
VSDNSVGKAPVSGALVQCEAELVRLGRDGRDLGAQTRARTSRLQTPGVGATVNQELKMQIPVEMEIPLNLKEAQWTTPTTRLVGRKASTSD